MIRARPIDDLLQQLSQALCNTWPAGWLWSTLASTADYENSLARSVALIEELRESRDWRAVPSMLYLLSHDNEILRRTSASVIADLASMVPATSLPELESLIRDSTLQANAWHTMPLEQVMRNNWPAHVWALYSMHQSGYVREAALRQLISAGDASAMLPFLLPRLNDWVAQIREFATASVRAILADSHPAAWIPVLSLLQQLRRRSRADHSWINQQVAALFLRRDAKPALLQAVQSSDLDCSRWAFDVAMTTSEAERAEFVRLGLESSDPGIRLKAAKAVTSSRLLPERAELLAIMSADPFMPVRREVIYATLDSQDKGRRTHLLSALFDRHPSIRHAAKYYLRKESEQSNAKFDAHAHYVGALADHIADPSIGIIAGIGETGSATDIATVAPFLTSPRPKIAAAAVRAIAVLDRHSRLPWFAELLNDPRPAVAKEASRALLHCPDANVVSAIRTIVSQGAHPHSRRLALRLLLRRHPYEATADAIRATASTDPALSDAAVAYIEKLVPQRVAYVPNRSQIDGLVGAIRSLPTPLAAMLFSRVQAFMGIALG